MVGAAARPRLAVGTPAGERTGGLHRRPSAGLLSAPALGGCTAAGRPVRRSLRRSRRRQRTRTDSGPMRRTDSEPMNGDAVNATARPGEGRAARLIGVGVGPGDPELVTLKALRSLREADLALVPVLTPEEEGRAESVVRDHGIHVTRVVFALNDRGGVTARRAAAWEAAADRVIEAFAAGARTVAFATIGDPNVYSTFTYLAQTVRDRAP